MSYLSLVEKQAKILREMLTEKRERDVLRLILEHGTGKLSKSELEEKLKKFPIETIDKVTRDWYASIIRTLIEIVTDLEKRIGVLEQKIKTK